MKRKLLKNENLLRELLLAGEFNLAYDIARKLPYRVLENSLIKLGFDEQKKIIYDFICYMIGKKECVEYHALAQTIMCHPLCYIDGAYETALCHNKRILELDKDNMDAKLMMLFYNTLPDKLVDDAQAINMAKEILEKDSSNETALRRLGEL